MGGRSCYSKVRDAFTTDNKLAKILMAEFLGTFVLIALGDASVAQKFVSRGDSGQFISVNIAWGIAVSMGIWVSGGASGGHLNPAVTFAFCIMGRTPWHQFPIYWIGQYVGALAGAAAVFGVYYQAMEDMDGGVRMTGGPNDTAGIFSTFPKDYLDQYGGLGDQILATALLLMLILAITDENNMKPSTGMVPFCVGLIVTVIGMSMGHNCGYAINPARDWGPRILTCIAGWGTKPFTFREYQWFWVPFAGPHIGAIAGGWIYLIFVGNHIRPKQDPDDTDTDKENKIPHSPPYAYDNQKPSGQSAPYNEMKGNIEMRGMENQGYKGDPGPPTSQPNYRADDSRVNVPSNNNWDNGPEPDYRM